MSGGGNHSGGSHGEKKDPWHKDSIEETIEKRKRDRTNLLGVIKAMDSQLVYEIGKLLQEHGKEGEIPDWSLLDEESPNYSKDAAEAVRKKIDEVYSLDSKLHPLAGVIKKAEIEKNYFNESALKGLYFEHAEELKRQIGKHKNLLDIIEQAREKNYEMVAKRTGKQMFGDVDPEKHGDYIIDFLHEKYHFEKEKVHLDLMKQSAAELLAQHHNRALDAEAIHRAYKKKEAKVYDISEGQGHHQQRHVA